MTQHIVHRINTTAPRVLARLQVLSGHMRFLHSVAGSKAVDPVHLLRVVNEARAEAMQLHHQLTGLADLRSGIRRRHLGDGHATFASGFAGTMKRIHIEFGRLDEAISDLHRAADERLNDPGRYGDAAAANPVNDVVSLVTQLLELWHALRVRRKFEGD